jgi:hypothetical protein
VLGGPDKVQAIYQNRADAQRDRIQPMLLWGQLGVAGDKLEVSATLTRAARLSIRAARRPEVRAYSLTGLVTVRLRFR